MTWELGLSPVRGEEEVKVEGFKIRTSYGQIYILEKRHVGGSMENGLGGGVGTPE